MASVGKANNLECGLCLEAFKNPKMLPCHHTYCAGCLKDLVKSTVKGPVPCPSCRKDVQLPPGGVSQLQTNFYLAPLLNSERCTLHRTENFRFYCTDCKTPICRDCRMTDHLKHDAQDLAKAVNEAKEELNDCKGRLSESENVLRKQLMEVEERMYFSGQTCEALTRQVKSRVEKLTSLATKYGDEIVKELETLFISNQDRRCAKDRLSTVRALQQEVTQGLEGGNSQSLFTLSTDMRTGRGSKQQLDQLTSALPVHTEHCVLRYDDNSLQRDVIRKYLGHVGPFQPIPLQQSVRITEMFRCCHDTQLYVHAVCAENNFNQVYLAYGAGGTGGEGWVVRHDQNGQLMEKLSETIRGRVCLADLDNGWVRAEGKEFPATDWYLDKCLFSDNNNAQRKYDVYNKGDVRSALRAYGSGLCEMRSVKITNFATTTDVKVCEMSAKTPVAMDVSKDGRLVAVLEEGQDHVMLYRHGNTKHHAIYRGHGEAFRPLDVCFYMIGGEERLVIADWLNDVLHVVEVGESCKLIGHMGGDCLELVKPTALYADREGYLWIGCQGGHVFKLRDTDFSPNEEESDFYDERHDSEVVHSEPKRRKTCVE